MQNYIHKIGKNVEDELPGVESLPWIVIEQKGSERNLSGQ